jgi:hypothetical protein
VSPPPFAVVVGHPDLTANGTGSVHIAGKDQSNLHSRASRAGSISPHDRRLGDLPAPERPQNVPQHRVLSQCTPPHASSRPSLISDQCLLFGNISLLLPLRHLESCVSTNVRIARHLEMPCFSSRRHLRSDWIAPLRPCRPRMAIRPTVVAAYPS